MVQFDLDLIGRRLITAAEASIDHFIAEVKPSTDGGGKLGKNCFSTKGSNNNSSSDLDNKYRQTPEQTEQNRFSFWFFDYDYHLDENLVGEVKVVAKKSSPYDQSSLEPEAVQVNVQSIPKTAISSAQEGIPSSEFLPHHESPSTRTTPATLTTLPHSATKTKLHHAPNEFEHSPLVIRLSVYFTWLVLMLHAYLREFLRYYGYEENRAAVELESQRDFVPLFSSFEPVYARNCYMRVRDVFERPIGGVPGATVSLLDRCTDDYCWSFKFTGAQTEVINVGSYNYLGFAQADGHCAAAASAAIDEHGLALCSTINEVGMNGTHARLEHQVASFLGVEEAICFSMGFATNSMNLVCLCDAETLIVSDQHNHASLIVGCRAATAGVTTRIFPHNDMRALERVLRGAVVKGNPRTGKPYSKILIVLEGVYSMEGSICPLPEVVRLKKRYKCYLYLDEAHSVGAMGPHGRGITDYWGVDPRDIDVMMGTFTKSFGAAGGYLAGRRTIIQHLRRNSPTAFYSAPMSPAVAEQIATSMRTIMGLEGGDDGPRRLAQLAWNVRYFRRRLKQLGFIVYGSDDSPVVPIMLYHPTKCGLWGREMLARGVGVVVVSFPATEMTESRCRICLSAAHTREILDKVLEAINEVGELSRTKHSRHPPPREDDE